jgi:hypothetical protein
MESGNVNAAGIAAALELVTAPAPSVIGLEIAELRACTWSLEKFLRLIVNVNSLPGPPIPEGTPLEMANMLFTFIGGQPLCCEKCHRDVTVLMARSIAIALQRLLGDGWHAWWRSLVGTLAPALAWAGAVPPANPGVIWP